MSYAVSGYVKTGYVIALATLLALFGAGCGSGASEGPPSGWKVEADRWWQEGVDTARAFRSLDDFAAMGLAQEEVVLEASVSAHRQREALRERLRHGVRRSLLPLYRHAPEALDSIFRTRVVPRLDTAEALSRSALADRIRSEARWAERRMGEIFRPPRLARPDSDQVGITVPDSLEGASVHGCIRTRIYLDQSGRPRAVRLLEGLHPALDRSVLRAAARSRWQPARVSGDPIPSWTTFAVQLGGD